MSDWNISSMKEVDHQSIKLKWRKQNMTMILFSIYGTIISGQLEQTCDESD